MKSHLRHSSRCIQIIQLGTINGYRKCCTVILEGHAIGIADIPDGASDKHQKSIYFHKNDWIVVDPVPLCDMIHLCQCFKTKANSKSPILDACVEPIHTYEHVALLTSYEHMAERVLSMVE